MADYVDRKDVRLTFRAVAPIIPWNTLDYILSLIPSAEPELIEQAAYVRGFEQGRTQGMIDAQLERKNGKWICWYEEIENDTCTEYIPHCKCSECGTEYDSHTVKFINFCSYCGAKMQLSNEDATFK